jgi:hypothetical protein
MVGESRGDELTRLNSTGGARLAFMKRRKAHMDSALAKGPAVTPNSQRFIRHMQTNLGKQAAFHRLLGGNHSTTFRAYEHP